MNEKRDMQAVPVKLGCISRNESITLWVFVPTVYRKDPKREARRTAFQRAKKRRQTLDRAMEQVYRIITCGSCMGMLYLLWRMI